MPGNLGSGAAMVAFGGGPSRVVNKTYISAALALKKNGATQIFSPRFGLKGILDSNPPQVYDLARQPESLLMRIADQAGAAAGTARRKLDASKGEPERLLWLLKQNDIRYFYLIGGDDTASVCLSLQSAASACNYELATFHLAKTIDNDLNGHHHTPGYGSAALYVAHAVHGMEADNCSVGGVQIVVCMGKDAGYLTAAAALAKEGQNSGPHVFFLPEQAYGSAIEFATFFTEKVSEAYQQFGRALAVVSEGIGITSYEGAKQKRTPLLKHILESSGGSALGDNFGGVSLSRGTALGDFLVGLVKSKVQTDVRSTTLGYPQRSFSGIFSEPDAADAWAVGEWAAKYTLNGERAGSIALNHPSLRRSNPLQTLPPPNGNNPVSLIPLSVAGNGKREMPQEFLSCRGCLLNTEPFLEYLLPLVGNDKLPPSLVGLQPTYAPFRT